MIKGYKVLDLDTNSIYISRDIVFYESIFPYASDSFSSTSYLTDFVFPHVTSDPSCTSDFISSNAPAPSIPIDTSISDSLDTPNLVVSTPNPIPLEPNTHTSIPNPISNSDSVVIPTVESIQPPLRRSTRPHIPPSYLSDYSYKSIVSAKPQFGLPYTLSNFLSYSHLGPTFKSFILAISAALSKPVSFHQAVQYPEWRATMDKEIEALKVNNTWTLAPSPPSKIALGYKWVYRIKYLPDGSIERYKAHLVAKGFT